MSYPYYIVDAFAEEVFKGNPAAVYVLEKWLPEAVMQNIAIENNLSETAFTVKEGKSYALRWFTPEREIDLCGHATLATAFVLFNYYSVAEETLHFTSQSGPLAVTKKEEYYYLDFPYILPERIPIIGQRQCRLLPYANEYAWFLLYKDKQIHFLDDGRLQQCSFNSLL